MQRLVRRTAKGFIGGSTVASSGALGLTQAVCQVFEIYEMELTPVLIRDLLPTVGFETSHYKEPLTAIHAILRRLISRSIIVRIEAPDGFALYVRTKSAPEADAQTSPASTRGHPSKRHFLPS
jgi:hypothetical protein